MKRLNESSKTYRVFTVLKLGRKLTEAQARKMGVKNLRAEVSRIRDHGYAVYTNTREAGNGVRVTEYEIGQPSREIVALGYKARRLGIQL